MNDRVMCFGIETLFQIIMCILNAKTTQNYPLDLWVFVLKVTSIDHKFITTWSGMCNIWLVTCLVTLVNVEKVNRLSFINFWTCISSK